MNQAVCNENEFFLQLYQLQKALRKAEYQQGEKYPEPELKLDLLLVM